MSIDHSSKNSALSLTEEEVLDLLENKNSNALADIADKIAGAYAKQPIKPTDAMATEQIFRLLMRETELRVRVALAEHVKSSSHLPKDIVMSMAKDVEQVALPILEHSDVLTDKDLIELVSNTQEIKRYLAISKREHVSDVVSDSLLARGNDEVAVSLVKNNGATISAQGLEKMVEHFPQNQNLMHAISNRPQLPPAVAEKLINVVSSSLASTLKEKYKAPGKEIEQEVEKTREGETLRLISTSTTQDEVNTLIAHLMSVSRLTPSLILSALCQGNFCFFETALARLSNIPVANARTLIKDRGELGFRAIYNKSGLPESMFPAVKILLKVVHDLDDDGRHPGSSGYVNSVIERILQHSAADSTDNLSYIIALVRRTSQQS